MESNRTLLTNELLNQKIAIFKDIVICLEEIAKQPEKGGVPATSICLSHGVNFLVLRRLINFKEIDKIRIDSVIDHHDIEIKDNPFERLYRAIFGLSENDAINYPNDLEESTEYSLDAYLSTREADVLKYRFGLYDYSKTLEEIGEMFNLSKSRVRQIEIKALRKLRGNKSSMIIKDGLNEYEKEKAEKELQEKQKLEQLKEFVNDLQIICNNKSSFSTFDQKKIVHLVYELTKDISLVDVDMSTKLKNCIGRSKYLSLSSDSLFDLFIIDDELLKSIRNFGDSKLAEVEALCDSFLKLNTINRKIFKSIFKETYNNYSRFIDMHITPDLIEKAKNNGIIDIYQIIDYVSEQISMKKYFNFKIPYSMMRYENMLYFISKSKLYYEHNNLNNSDISIITSKCNRYLQNNFGVSYSEYLENKYIIRTPKNEQEFNRRYENIKYMVEYVVNKLVTDNPRIGVDSNINRILTEIINSVYRWASSEYRLHCDEVQWDEPKVRFTKSTLDPNVLYTIALDVLSDKY